MKHVGEPDEVDVDRLYSTRLGTPSVRHGSACGGVGSKYEIVKVLRRQCGSCEQAAECDLLQA